VDNDLWRTVKLIEQRTAFSAAMIALVGLLAGCGAGSDEGASPASLPYEEPIATESSATLALLATDEPAGAEPQLTAEMFEEMLETEAGRSLLVASIAAEIGVEPEAAGCLLDAIPVETLAEAASSFLGRETDERFFSEEQVADFAPLLDSCGIAPEALQP